MLDEEARACRAIGERGADLLQTDRPLRLLTHCNTGWLAAVEWGTALGIVTVLHERGQVEHVYADETRPLLQGARLTAWELAALRIDHRVVVDGAAPSLIARGLVDAVVVGADRIAANGDVANKVGTYPLALAAARAGIPFVVAAPESTVDAGHADRREHRDRGARPGRGGRGAGVQPGLRRDAGRPGDRRGDRAADRTAGRRRDAVTTRLVADAVLPCDGTGAVHRPGARRHRRRTAGSRHVGPVGRAPARVHTGRWRVDGPAGRRPAHARPDQRPLARADDAAARPGRGTAAGPLAARGDLAARGQGRPGRRLLGDDARRRRDAPLRRDHLGGDVLPRRPAGRGRRRGRQPLPASRPASWSRRAGSGSAAGPTGSSGRSGCATGTPTTRGSRSASARTRRTCCRTRRWSRSARRPGRPARR